MAIRQLANALESAVAQRGRTALEFLVVCREVSVLKIMAEAVHGCHGRLIYSTTMGFARRYVSRRKIDGIILDMRLEGAAELVHAVRDSQANKFSVIFGCHAAPGAVAISEVGANLVLRAPLTPQRIIQTFNSALSRMTAERRRYVRHPVVAPVMVNLKGVDSQATLSNLSLGGMRIWSLETHRPGAVMRFAFVLPDLGSICGSGAVTRTSPEGLTGVKFGLLENGSYERLWEWIERREAQAN